LSWHFIKGVCGAPLIWYAEEREWSIEIGIDDGSYPGQRHLDETPFGCFAG